MSPTTEIPSDLQDFINRDAPTTLTEFETWCQEAIDVLTPYYEQEAEGRRERPVREDVAKLVTKTGVHSLHLEDLDQLDACSLVGICVQEEIKCPRQGILRMQDCLVWKAPQEENDGQYRTRGTRAKQTVNGACVDYRAS